MTIDQINSRIDNLIIVHAYTNITNTHFSDNQRICLSQERASWMSVLDGFDAEPRYQIPEHLERKMTAVIIEINKNQWIKPEYEKEPY